MNKLKLTAACLGGFLTLFASHLSSAEQTMEKTLMQPINQELHNKLPAAILQKGELNVINNGSSPPYVICNADNSVAGAMADLFNVLGQLLGVKIKYESASGITAVLTGIDTGRYDITMMAFADGLVRQKNNDFVDFMFDVADIAVKKGNPLGIKTMTDLCGKRVAVQSGTVGEKRVNEQSKICMEQGKAAIKMQTYPDQTTTMFAVQSNRADAYWGMASIVSWYVSQSKDELEVANLGLDKSYPYSPTYQGLVVAKNSPLGPILLQSLQQLQDNGTLKQILQPSGLDKYMLDKIGLNIATYN